MHTLTERTYVNRDSTKIVKEGSADAAYLLGIAGDEISDETAKRLGLGTSVPVAADYGKLKVDELKGVLAERGIEVPSDAKKADLVDALEESDRVAKEAETETGGSADQGAPEETAAASSPAEA